MERGMRKEDRNTSPFNSHKDLILFQKKKKAISDRMIVTRREGERGKRKDERRQQREGAEKAKAGI